MRALPTAVGRTARAWGLVATLVAGAAVVLAAPSLSGAAPGDPTMTVEPATGLVDGQSVTLTFSGLEPYSYVNAAQCVAAFTSFQESCDLYDGPYAEVDGEGNASVTLKVDAVLTTGYGGGEPTAQHDCRPAGACIIGATAGPHTLVAEIAFDPDAPLAPPPTATVTPDTGLTDYQGVAVHAEGLVWASNATVIQCVAAEPLGVGDCDHETSEWVDTTDVDAIDVDYQVSTIVNPADHGNVDCRASDACVLVVTGDDLRSASKSAVVPLAFDPDGAVVPASLTVTPSTGLRDGQVVTAQGGGFPPGRWVELMVCASTPSWDTCDWVDGFAEIDDTGTFSIEVSVPASIVTFNPETGHEGEIDCRTAAEPCFLLATPGSPSSARAARAELHFDPNAPLRPAPAITVSPSSNLPDEATVTVTGSNFTPHGDVAVAICEAGSSPFVDNCDEQTTTFVEPDTSGAFSIDVAVAATFQAMSGDLVDCYEAPGCEMAATDFSRNRTARAALSFAPPPAGSQRRWFDPVFDSVDITHDVVYRDTVDSRGNPVQLELDIYQPAGDTAEQRPAMVWMPGGWFSSGSDLEPAPDMVAYADAFARRGYVSVVMEYRQRPELNCCPATDPDGVTAALLDGHDDAVAGLEWLHEHAAEYRIDPRAIAVGGADAGAANSFSVAYAPEHPGGGGGGGGGHGHAAAAFAGQAGDGSLAAAAIPIEGVSLGEPAANAPPVLAFHSETDLTAPLHLAEWECDTATRVGDVCETVGYGTSSSLAVTRQRDIVRRSTEFLATHVLDPLGYIEDPEPPGSSTTTSGPSTTAGSSASTTIRQPGGGNLARTGTSSTWTLVRVGVAMALLGAALALAARQRRQRFAATTTATAADGPAAADHGWVSLRAALLTAGLTGALLAAMTVPGIAAGASPDQADDDTTSSSDPTATTEPADADSTTSISVGGDPVDTSTSTEPSDSTTSTSVVVEPDDGDDGDDAEVTNGEDHDGDGFPDDWTPEQRAFAEDLIRRTETSLTRYANDAILPLLGYSWIFDGGQPGGYMHWVSLSRVFRPDILDPDQPESLVFYNGPHGRELQAAMYILPTGYTMDNIPADIAWLPGWHIHDNLCFDSNGRIVGLANEDGVCEQGFLVITPPMVHVWIVDTPCGRFAGVDEHGLMCDHDGGHGGDDHDAG